MFFFLRSVRTAAKVANNLPNFSNLKKKCKKNEKSLFLTGSFTFNATKYNCLVFNDCFVRANASASTATNA